jgi:Flp pilus assembly protein TadG
MNMARSTSRGVTSRLRRARAGEGVCDERGTALVEFTLVLPVLLLILFGVLAVGEALNQQIVETNLVNEAARYAAVNYVPSGTLQSYIKSQATGQLTSPTVCVSFPAGTENVGDPVQVTMTSTYSWIQFLQVQANFPGTTTITRTATMRLEATPSYSAGC